MNRKNKKKGVFGRVANVIIDEFMTIGLPRPFPVVLWRCLVAAVSSEPDRGKQQRTRR